MGGCSCESLNAERYESLVNEADPKNRSKIKRILQHDKYKITPVNVGRGLTSVVAIAIDRKGKKYAAKQIKKYSKEYKDDWVKKEAEISLLMNHPNIIKTYEIYEDESSVNFIMELCEKGDLVQYLNSKQGKLDNLVIINIFIQVLDSINYMHNILNICHRDIKLENFLMASNDEKCPKVKLIDFGFATRFIKGQKMTDQLGTLEYMSPELLSNNGYNEKTDIWSCGVLLYVLTNGKLPFKKNANVSINDQIIKSNINFNIIKEPNIRELCQKLMERNPNKRPGAQEALQLARNAKNNIDNGITS